MFLFSYYCLEKIQEWVYSTNLYLDTEKDLTGLGFGPTVFHFLCLLWGGIHWVFSVSLLQGNVQPFVSEGILPNLLFHRLRLGANVFLIVLMWIYSRVIRAICILCMMHVHLSVYICMMWETAFYETLQEKSSLHYLSSLGISLQFHLQCLCKWCSYRLNG